MAVVNVTSLAVQLAEGNAAAGQYLSPRYAGTCRILCSGIDFAQGAAAGDATSQQRLVKLPAGALKIIGIYLANSAFGASRTLDVGYEAYEALSDGSAVAASTQAFWAALDVSAAGGRHLWFNVPLDNRSGLTITSAVAGGTIPAAATIKGYVLHIGE